MKILVKCVPKFPKNLILGSYEVGVVDEAKVFSTIPIQNYLMPYMGQTEAEGSREERLRQLLTALEWKHLTKPKGIISVQLF